MGFSLQCAPFYVQNSGKSWVGTNTCSAKTNLEIVGIPKVEKSSVELITFARMTIGRLNHQKVKYQLYT